MNLQNAIADFQLKGTSIKRIDLNNDFVQYSDNERTEKKFNVSYNIEEISERDDGNSLGTMVLLLEIEISQEDNKLNILLEIEGCFSYNGDSKDEFMEMLEINGSATMYSIARSIILTITSQTFAGEKILLPMVNFFKLREENE